MGKTPKKFPAVRPTTITPACPRASISADIGVYFRRSSRALTLLPAAPHPLAGEAPLPIACSAPGSESIVGPDAQLSRAQDSGLHSVTPYDPPSRKPCPGLRS